MEHPRELRIAVALAVAVALAAGEARARFTAPPDEKAIDAKYREANVRYLDGEFLTAARLWTAAGEMYPEESQFKKARARIFKDVAESYHKVMMNGGGLEIAREALDILDRYAEQFAAAYPGESLHGRIAAVRATLREQVDAADAEARAQAAAAAEAERPAPPPVQTPPPPRPWRGLMAGGGVLVGGSVALLGAAAAGVVLARDAERYVEDPAHQCYQPISGVCADYDARGAAANGLFVAGLVGAPLLLGAGTALLVVAARRKNAGRASLAPVFSRSLVGLTWRVHM